MDQSEVIERFCSLAGEVNRRQFGWRVATDCFCGPGANGIGGPSGFSFDEVALEFIEIVVRAALPA